MRNVRMLCDLLDLRHADLDQALDLLQGQIGINGITIPVWTPSVCEWRVPPIGGAHFVRTDGGLQFHPDESRYERTHCKPAGMIHAATRDLLDRTVDACRNRAMQVRLRVHAGDAGRLIKRYPQTAALPAASHDTQLRACLINPDVSALFDALAAELDERFLPDAIELAEFHIGRHASTAMNADHAINVGPGGRALLAMCFCPSCMQLADCADPADGPCGGAAGRSVRARLQKIWSSGTPLPGAGASLLADDPPLSNYVAAQWTRLHQSLADMRAKTRCELVVQRYTDAVTTPPLPDGRPCDAPRMVNDRPNADAVLSFIDPMGDAQWQRTAAADRSLHADGLRVEFALPAFVQPSAIAATSPVQALGRSLSQLAEMGVDDVTLHGFGRLPNDGVDVARQAVRFAKRQANV